MAQRTAWLRRTYPVLFALFPILALAAHNPGRYLARDVLILCALSGVAVVLAVATVVTLMGARRRNDRNEAADVAALIVFSGVVLFYGYPMMRSIFVRAAAGMRVAAASAYWSRGGARERDVFIALIVVLALCSLVWWSVARTARGAMTRVGSLVSAFAKQSARPVGTALSGAGAMLVLSSLCQLGYVRLADARTIANAPLMNDLRRPVATHPVTTQGGPRAPKRDIYVVILDEYAAADVYRDRYGFDNTAFEDSLRALGFRIPQSVRSNYAVTLLSLTSLLNFAHARSLADAVDSRSSDYGVAGYLIEHNRAARFLKAQGYRYVLFPSREFTPTARSDVADEVYDPEPGFDVARAAYGSELIYQWVQSTPVASFERFFQSYTAIRSQYAMHTLDALTTVAVRPRGSPVFAVAHVLMPHWPYTVDSDCRPRPAASYNQADTSGLAAQVRCLNRLTLRTVRALIARSATPPIIILQGDHGSQALHPFDNPPGALTPDQARERFQPLGAYFLPDGGAAALPDSVSIVNVLRYVFAYYFGADLPPLPNTMFFSSWRSPYSMTRVTDDFRLEARTRTASHARAR